jgi:hypothetical protein
MSVETVAVPSNWAGGEHVSIPGLGVGRIILHDPRVIEVPLPAPECAVFLVDGRRAVVLADPRVPYARTLHAIAMARHLEGAGEDELSGLRVAVGDDTPACGLPVTATHPRLQLVRPVP